MSNQSSVCPTCGGRGKAIETKVPDYTKETITGHQLRSTVSCPGCDGTGWIDDRENQRYKQCKHCSGRKPTGRKSEPLLQDVSPSTNNESEPVSKEDCPTPDSPGVVFHKTVNDTSWADPTPDLDFILRENNVTEYSLDFFTGERKELYPKLKQSLERWATERVVAELEFVAVRLRNNEPALALNRLEKRIAELTKGSKK